MRLADMLSLPSSGITDRERAHIVMALSMRLTLVITVVAGLVLVFCITSDRGVERAIGVLIAIATLVSGSGIGFLFGIPRTVQNEDASARLTYKVNTNLEQISDWLTKIIVGLTLVNLTTIPDRIATIGQTAGTALGPHGSIIVQTTVCVFAPLGFIFGYLATRLYLAPALPFADHVSFDAFAQKLGPALDALSQQDQLQPPHEADRPSPTRAVQRLASAAAEARPPASEMPLQTARATALALYLTGKYPESLRYFDRADEQPEKDVRFATQHAIALGESGEYGRAAQLLERVASQPDGPPETKKLLGYYLLWVPSRLNDSVKYTTEYLGSVKADDDGAIFNLACANAQLFGQTTQRGYLELAEAALRDAFAKNPAWKARAQQLRTDDFAALPADHFTALMREDHA